MTWLTFCRTNPSWRDRLPRRIGFASSLNGTRTTVIAVTAVCVTLLTASVISTFLAFRAVRAERVANERRAEAESVSNFLVDVFQSPDPERDGPSDYGRGNARSSRSKALKTDLADQPERRAKLKAVLGKTYQSLGLNKEAAPLLETSYEYARQSG